MKFKSVSLVSSYFSSEKRLLEGCQIDRSSYYANFLLLILTEKNNKEQSRDDKTSPVHM